MRNRTCENELPSLGEAMAFAVDVTGCREAGLSDGRRRWLVESGRWQSPFPGV